MTDTFDNTSNCLNFRFEPRWEQQRMNWKNQLVRRGFCRWPFMGSLDKQLPLSVTIRSTEIEYRLGESGINYNCPAWQGKEKKSEE